MAGPQMVPLGVYSSFGYLDNTASEISGPALEERYHPGLSIHVLTLLTLAARSLMLYWWKSIF